MSKKTTRMKPLHFYAPITRINEEERIVEGYAFVNEVVDGEGGIRLKRSAMEAATPDYLRWGAVREMHQPQAAGTATAPGCGIEWDAQGAFLRAKIVDDQAWEKVKEGVYKGFSLGVLPRLMRGKDVEACTWIENSLVDRPKDGGAVITMFRADGIDLDEEVEVEVEDEAPLERAAPSEDVPRSFADVIQTREAEEALWELDSAYYDLFDVLYVLATSGREDREARMRTSLQQFTDYVVPRLCGEERAALDAALQRLQRRPEAAPDLTRVQTLETERAELLQRAETLSTENGTLLERAEAAENELATVQRTLTAAEERVRTLEAEPAPLRAPVRFPQALQREFAANQQQTASAEITALQAELQRLETELPAEPDAAKKRAGVIRYNTIRQELAVLGVRG